MEIVLQVIQQHCWNGCQRVTIMISCFSFLENYKRGLPHHVSIFSLIKNYLFWTPPNQLLFLPTLKSIESSILAFRILFSPTSPLLYDSQLSVSVLTITQYFYTEKYPTLSLRSHSSWQWYGQKRAIVSNSRWMLVIVVLKRLVDEVQYWVASAKPLNCDIISCHWYV